jgi:hypothetical protein
VQDSTAAATYRLHSVRLLSILCLLLVSVMLSGVAIATAAVASQSSGAKATASVRGRRTATAKRKAPHRDKFRKAPRRKHKRHRVVPARRPAPAVISPSAPSSPGVTATATATAMPPLVPSAQASTSTQDATTAPSSGTTQTGGEPTSTDKVLFQTTYPSSGDSSVLPATGWQGVSEPAFGSSGEDNPLQFVDPPGSPSGEFFPSTSVARFELQAGALTSDGEPANRVEVYGRSEPTATPAREWPDPVGATRWYNFSIYIPSGFPVDTGTKWFIFVQWKGASTGSPPVALEINRSQFVLGSDNTPTIEHGLGGLNPGSWTQFVVGIHFSDSASDGWVTVYRNGALALPTLPLATMNSTTVDGVAQADPTYLKMGIYRDLTWDVTQVIDLTPVTIGTSYASVA